jgi:hypothetical protein
MTFACSPCDVVATEFGDTGDAIIDLNPVGQPRGVAQKPNGPTYFVWYEDGIWHLRATTVRKHHQFAGVVRIRDGRISRLAAASMDHHRRRGNDAGRVSRDGRRVDFRFETKGGVDGFDFVVVGKDASVDFDLRINGTTVPSRVEIGLQSSSAPSGVFSFPADPESGS